MCPTCQDTAHLPAGDLCPACVCPACLARQARVKANPDPHPSDDYDDPQECTSPQCGWARAMGCAA